MDNILNKVMFVRNESETKEEIVSRARSRALAAVGLILGTIAACVIAYVVFSSFSHLGPDSDREPELKKMIKPDLYICSGESQPPAEALKRAKRQRVQTNKVAALIKRVPRPLSLPPPAHNLNLNYSYNPPLYHDAGARCAWGRLSNKRVPHLEDVGIAYDFQQIDARQCDDPEECKSMCLRMHKTDDPYLCNYFTWHRQKKLALFYFLEPTLKWNLTEDNRVETFFWQCRETNCNWWWRPHRVWSHLSDLTPAQLRRSQGLLAVTQCSDFASCQFSCETRPSYRELGLGNQIPEGAQPDDPSCSYVVMPSKGTQNRESFLYTMPQEQLKNVSYRGSSFYDSFELVCDPPQTTQFPSFLTTQASAGLAPQPAAGAATPPPPPAGTQPPPPAPTGTQPSPLSPAVGTQPPPPPPAGTQPPAPPAQGTQPPPPPPEAANATINKRQKRDVGLHEIKMRECRLKGEQIDCSRLQVIDPLHPSECLQLNAETVSEAPATITLESKHPVWLVMQHQASLDDFEQSLELAPGQKHTVDVMAQKVGKDDTDRCGPPHLRHRRCTSACTDRIAVDACGCTLTPEGEGSANALLTVPICDEDKIRQCVHPHLTQASDSYFECMKECKADCASSQKPFTLRNKASSLSDQAKDTIQMDLSFLTALSQGQSINTRPINNIDAHQFVYIWVPIMIMAVLFVAFVLLYCAKRLM